jgi:hypothetical protein
MREPTPEEQRLREAFASLTDTPPDDGSCPSPERIVESADGRLRPPEDREVILHIGECAACSAAWWLARETSEDAQAGSGATLPRARTPALRGWPALAAAALLILLVGVTVYQVLQPRQPAEPVFRSQQEAWLTSQLPAGQPLPRDACTLRWTAGPPETTYDITVTSEDLEALATAAGLAGPDYRVDPEALADLTPGAAILWRVTAHLPDGGRHSSETFRTIVE